MKRKMKRCSVIISLMLAFFITIIPINAATITKSGTVNSDYSIIYPYSFKYSATIGYNSPGNGTIYSYSDLTLTPPAPYSGYRAVPRQSKKTLNSSKTTVTYEVSVDIEVFLGIGSYMYVGTKKNTIKITSPGPSRSIDEGSLDVTVQEGELYYDPVVASQY